MIRWLWILGLLFVVGCTAAPEGAAVSPNVDTTDFTLNTLDGDTFALSEQRGNFVLVNFWATWCVPCRKEMPYLQAINDKHEQLIVAGINMNEDADRVQSFIDEMGFTFPILLDPPSNLTIEHHVRNLPVSFVVDPNGEIIHRQIGEILPEQFDAWLAENL